jgi:integrase
MAAMILLGINAGLGNSDLGDLPLTALDLKGGWLNYPRGKTGINRRVPLWPETVKAIQKAIADRPEPKDEGSKGLVFVGGRGENYVAGHKGYRVGAEFKRTLDKAGFNTRTFYDLRRTFQTVGEGAHDLAAVQSIMGHAPPEDDMSSRYRQRVEDARLRAVTDHVRRWLFPRKRKGVGQ